MVALLDEDGARREGDRSFAYGEPFGLPRSDVDGDGDVDGTDYSLLSAAFGKSVGDVGYDVRADINLDGTIDTSDSSDLFTDYGQSLGRGNLSRDPTLNNGVGNRLGYAGYWWDPGASKYHVRNRVEDPVSGTWLSRDPIGYVDGANLYEYVGSRGVSGGDPSGLSIIYCPVIPPSPPYEDPNYTPPPPPSFPEPPITYPTLCPPPPDGNRPRWDPTDTITPLVVPLDTPTDPFAPYLEPHIWDIW